MRTAPRDGTILDVRLGPKGKETIYRMRWLAPRKIWIDWDRQHVELYKSQMRGWRISEQQFRPWTPEEVSILAQLHREEEVVYLDIAAWQQGIRKVVPGPS